MACTGWLNPMYHAALEYAKTWYTGLFTPWMATWEPVQELLDATADQDALTEKWHDTKLDELRFVGITVSFDIS